MEGRMTLCNMSIEAGAVAGLIAVDATTLQYCRERFYAPQGSDWDRAALEWTALQSDPDARFDAEVAMDVSGLSPQVTWGTSPDLVVDITGVVPVPALVSERGGRASCARALDYMGLTAGTPIESIALDKNFIKRDAFDRGACRQPHVVERPRTGRAPPTLADKSRNGHHAGDIYNQVRRCAPRHLGRQSRHIHRDFGIESGIRVRLQRRPFERRAIPVTALGRVEAFPAVLQGGRVNGDQPGHGARFYRHIAECHAPFHRQVSHHRAGILGRMARRAGRANTPDHRQRETFPAAAGRHRSTTATAQML